MGGGPALGHHLLPLPATVSSLCLPCTHALLPPHHLIPARISGVPSPLGLGAISGLLEMGLHSGTLSACSLFTCCYFSPPLPTWDLLELYRFLSCHTPFLSSAYFSPLFAPYWIFYTTAALHVFLGLRSSLPLPPYHSPTLRTAPTLLDAPPLSIVSGLITTFMPGRMGTAATTTGIYTHHLLP